MEPRKYTQLIAYKGKTFLFVNAAHLNEPEYVDVLKEYLAEGLARPGFPVLIDLTGAILTLPAVQAAKEIHQTYNQFRKEHHIAAQPVAVVGASAMIRAAANFIALTEKIYYAPDLDSAREWLFRNC